MKFSILHTSARPNKWREIYDAWMAAATLPENVEYVLCVDERWGFPPMGSALRWGWPATGAGANVLCYNTHPYKHSGYVSGVNTAAAASTGDVLVVIADDLWPCQGWDRQIEATFHAVAAPKSFMLNDWSMWAESQPGEFESGKVLAPILSRARYERIGYVLYPKYESMFADNDFFEHAHSDQKSLLIKGTLKFDHRHPINSAAETDPAYAATNHTEAYQSGKRILEARRRANFGELREVEIPARKIVIVYSGETFPSAWMQAWTDLIGKLATSKHQVTTFPAECTNVYSMRAGAAKEILDMPDKPDYILWIDDDNPPYPRHVYQLLQDLEADPAVGMVAGWTLTVTGIPSFGSVENGKRRPADLKAFLEAKDNLQLVKFTGFPMVLMRYAVLELVGWQGFWPLFDFPDGERPGEDRIPGLLPEATDLLGEDIGFCKLVDIAGFQILVDRRVKLEHLKTLDCCELFLPAGEAKREPAAPSAGTGQQCSYRFAPAFQQCILNVGHFGDHNLYPEDQGEAAAKEHWLNEPGKLTVRFTNTDGTITQAKLSTVPKGGIIEVVSAGAHAPVAVLDSRFCQRENCLLVANHPGSCYPGTANLALGAEPSTPEAS